MSNDDEWLEVDIEADLGTAPAVADVLESVALTLREAPDDRRYNVALTIDEVGTDE